MREYRAKIGQPPVILGILLAAGLGRRVGGPKALLTLDHETFHRRGVQAFDAAGLGAVVVVNPQIEGALPPPARNERRILNPDPDQPAGMFASVRLGIEAAGRLGATAVILLPVDHPLVTAEDIRAVAAALDEGAVIAVAVHQGRWGHPIGISRAVMAEIGSDPAVASLREVVRRDRSRVTEVEASLGAVQGVNVREDLERMSNRTFR